MSAVANYTTRACHKLRLQKSKAQGIYVYLRTNPFRRQDPQYNNGITYGFMEPSDDTTFIIQAARKCLGEIYSKGYKYHKAGIILLDIVPATYKQMEMFDTEETQARSQLMKTIERIKINLNPNLEIQGILLTMYDRRNKLSSQVEQEARNYFKDKVYQTVIPRNVRLSEAPSHGIPVLIYDKNCPGSKSYYNFTDEFIVQENKVGSAA